SGTKFVVDAGDTLKAKSVVITNVGGFTGSVFENKIGDAQAQVIGTTFRVQGTAQGANVDDPNHPASATFDIKANC
ncbi:MAG TPA: lipoprotein LpqH, partial [Mycobacterium sp.]|nr:lipoprotein LpqH [Mycobacterium sp.]